MNNKRMSLSKFEKLVYFGMRFQYISTLYEGFCVYEVGKDYVVFLANYGEVEAKNIHKRVLKDGRYFRYKNYHLDLFKDFESVKYIKLLVFNE